MNADTIALISAAVTAGATPDQLAAIVEAAQGTGVEVEAPTTPAKAPTKAPTKTKASKTKASNVEAKTYTWHPPICARYNIPAKVGETFEYHSKRSGATNVHRVTAVAKDGTVSSVRA